MTQRIALLCTFSTVPRTLRMAQLLIDSGNIVHVVEWDRTGQKPKAEIKNGLVFKRLTMKTRYGISAFFLMPVWLCFAFIQLFAEKYDVIQPQNLDSLIPAFISIRLGRGRKIIYDLADFYRDAYLLNIPVLRGLSAFLERLLIRKVEAIILTSERQILEVKPKNLPQKIVMFYNSPVDFRCQELHFKNEEKSIDAPLHFLYAGVLGFGRVRLLINVIKAMKGLPTKFYVAGYGEQESFLQELSKANSQVIFLGQLDHKEVMKLTQKADLVILPYDPSYLVNRVGLPNKLFEAMSCGAVPLAPSGTYMGEIVEKERIGLVVDYDDAIQLRSRIKELVSDRSSLKLFADKAKKVYACRFEPEKMTAEYLKLVKQVISD